MRDTFLTLNNKIKEIEEYESDYDMVSNYSDRLRKAMEKHTLENFERIQGYNDKLKGIIEGLDSKLDSVVREN